MITCRTMKRFVLTAILFTCCLCKRLELPAYEYLKRFNQPLYLGQCANRIVQYPEGPYPEPCLFPSRQGKTVTRFKEVESRRLVPIHDASQLMQYLGICDANAAEYFGLLAKGDCVATDIAGKMSFKAKTVTLMYIDHFRPRINSLEPEPEISDVPDEFTLYLNNTYYTENIGIGTEEVIIVQMMFKKREEAKKAYSEYSSMRLSERLFNIARAVATPRKVKVIRLSTSEEKFESETFKSQFAIFEAIQHVEQIEKQISRIKQELQQGMRSSHLKYSFKAYEIGPISLPMSTVSDEEKARVWRDVALLQVNVKRIYSTNRRYRKLCRGNVKHQKYCILMNQTLKELKKANTMIHRQRRDWLKISYEQQQHFLLKAKQKVKLLKTRTNMLSKILKN